MQKELAISELGTEREAEKESIFMGMDSQAQARNVRTHPPCSACRILRRRCDVNCILAPFFPAEEAENFVRVHKVFGASNVIKMLQMVDESRREDTVKSMVYEAHTRLKDPVYGCTGAIFYLQKHVKELEEQLLSARAEAMELRGQREQLLKALMDAHIVDPFSPVINDSVFDHFFVDAAAGGGPCSVPANSNSCTLAGQATAVPARSVRLLPQSDTRHGVVVGDSAATESFIHPTES